MSIIHGPRSVSSSRAVLYLDAANLISYDRYENLMTNSQLGNTILNDGGAVTLTTDTTVSNPFGESDGVLKCVHTINTPGYFRRGQSISLTAGVTYTFSVYFKNGTVSSPYGQGTPTPGPSVLVNTFSPTFQELGQSLNTNINVGNGWYRQVFTFTPSYTQTYNVVFNQAVNQTPIGTYYLYGFQLEIGSSVTDYYATTSTSKYRSNIWYDLSGNGNHATLVNGPTYNSSNGGSIVFDNVNDYGIINPSSTLTFDITTSYTISLWFKLTNLASSTFSLDTLFEGTGYARVWFFVDGRGGPGENYLRFNTYYGPPIYDGNGNIIGYYNDYYQGIGYVNDLNTWYNVVVIHDKTNLKQRTYLNGILDSEIDLDQIGFLTSPSNFVTTVNGTYFINSGTFGPTGSQFGIIQMYDKVLSGVEISYNFNSFRGRFGI